MEVGFRDNPTPIFVRRELVRPSRGAGYARLLTSLHARLALHFPQRDLDRAPKWKGEVTRRSFPTEGEKSAGSETS